MPQGTRPSRKSVNSTHELKIRFEENDGECIVTSNYVSFIADIRPTVSKLLRRKGLAYCTPGARSVEQTFLGDWDWTPDTQTSSLERLKPAIEREASLVQKWMQSWEETLAQPGSTTSIIGGDKLLTEYSRYSGAIVIQTIAELGRIVTSLADGAEKEFNQLVDQVNHRFLHDIMADDTAQKDLDMLAFKRLRAQELATRKYQVDRSALVSVVRAMQPLCDLGEKYQSFDDSQGPGGIKSVNPRPSDIVQSVMSVFVPQASSGSTVIKASNKYGQNVHKLMKRRYSEQSIREELRRVRCASLKQLCSELKEYCANDPDRQSGPETDPSEIAAGSSRTDVGAATSKKKKKPWYDLKEERTAAAMPSFTRPTVRTTWLPTESEEITHDDAPWEEVKASSVSKSGAPTGGGTVESQGPFAHYGWDFNEVFYRGLVIGSESRFHQRSMKPSPDFGTAPLLSPDAANVLARPAEAARKTTLSKEESDARDEWLRGAEQRQASWAEVWNSSVPGGTPVGSSNFDETEAVDEASVKSNADESNIANDPDLPEGVTTELPLAEYLDKLQL